MKSSGLPDGHFTDLTDQEIWNIANPIMDNLMSASTDIDHTRHVRDFTERLQRIVTPEHLAYVCQQYQSEKGHFTKREPVALFRRPDSVALVWRQFFSRVPCEYVAEIVLVREDDHYLIDHALVY